LNSIESIAAQFEVSTKGAKRIAAIVEAGAEILLTQGLVAVNKRRIAKLIGISDGNVSYYFPTRDSLWTAVVDFELDEYYRRHHSALEDAPDDPQWRFDEVVGSWVDEYQDRMVRIFFSQLITVGEINATIAGLRDKIYETFFEHLLSVSQPLVPKLADDELRQRILMAMALLEGLHAVSAFRPDTIKADVDFRGRVVTQVNDIIKRDY
jgi:AcrR family transcriptional regulator